MSKGDCIIIGDFNHGNIKWDTLPSTGVEDQTFSCLVQDIFLSQHVLEPTRATRVLDIVLSSQKEFVNNVVIQEPLGSSDHLTRFNKIATQGAPQMAVDKEANSLSRVYSYYSKFNLRLFYV